MRHKAYVLNAAIKTLAFVAAKAEQVTEIEQLRLEAVQGVASAQFTLG